MATAKKRSKKASASRSATAKKTTATRASAARKPAAAARKATGPAARAAGKAASGKAGKTATTRKKAGAAPARASSRGTSAGAVKKTATRAAGTAPKAAKKTATRKAPAAAAPKVAKTTKKAAPNAVKKKAAATKKAARKVTAPVVQGDATLFQPLSEGERAAALRVLTEDSRLSAMASVGRYRVIAIEPLVVKPSHELSQRRLARVVAYDYAAERSIDACVDLDGGSVTHLGISRSQPMLSREEEAAAIAIALGDEQVQSKLSLGDEAQVAMHYWSRSGTSLAYSRRSAAVLFGQAGRSPSLVAVVDLLDNLVCELVPATEW